MLPNFLVVGAQKSGTTSLHNYLIAHPDVYLPGRKETKFFVEDKFYDLGIKFYEEEYFSARIREPLVGEVDPDYMYCEQALPRIVHHLDLDALKIIFIFRNPVERAFSQYLMNYRRGREPLTFHEAIDTESSRIRRSHMDNLRYSYVARGNYLRQVERFLEYIDRSKLLFLLSEDLKTDALRCMRTVYHFLGVSEDFVPPNIGEQFHRAAAPRSPSLVRRIKGQGWEKPLLRLLIPSVVLRNSLRSYLLRINETSRVDMALAADERRRLAELFRSENDRLATFLGRDLSRWTAELSD